jgi:Tol biopolymer transport system component/DNA-binding winged helix-turn-helix (wHTH) protein
MSRNAERYSRAEQFHEFGPFRLELARRLLFRQDQVVPLTPKVLHTLLVLVENSGRVVSKDELMKAVWPDTFVEEGNLTQNISTLRKVLGENPGDHIYIETVPKQGYRFISAAPAQTEIETAPPPRPRADRRFIWAGVLALVMAVAGGVGWNVRRQPNVATSLTVTPLTSYAGLELHPSLSPDGNQVAFTWDGEKRDNLDIYVKVVGSDSSLRITFDAAQDFRPAWSPDGRWIAFLRATDGKKASIMRIPPTGGTEQKVAVVDPGDSASFDRAPLLEWTPDGKWLLTRERVPPDNAASLFLISVDSGEKKRLTFPPVGMGDLTATISVDGRTLAFSRTRSATLGKLCTLAMSSGYTPAGEPTCFAISDPRLANFGGIRCTPNRSEVMFSPLFRGPGRSSLWTMPLPQREGAVGVPQRFPIPSDSARDPVFSRDGRRLVYSDFREDADIWRLDLQKVDAGPLKLITSTNFDHGGEFSPDGKKIVFVSNRSGHPAVWVANNDGSNQTRLATREFPLAGMPRWSPDGQRIVFDTTEDGQFELYLINADGSGLRNLTQYSANDAVASWSRDGRWIYFSSSRSGEKENQIWKMPADGGEPTQLTRHGGHISSTSMDGKFLYYAKSVAGRYGLWRVPVTGGAEVKVLDSVFPFGFAVTGSGIYFIAASDDGSSIQFLSFKTGKVKAIAPVKGRVHPGLSVSPDGRFLLYSYAQLIGSDLMLAENF